MENAKQKIVFFFEKRQNIGGSLIFFAKIAAQIAHSGDFDVHYVNYPNAQIDKEFRDAAVTFHDIRACDFSQFENASFIVPLNYILPFLLHAKDIKRGKILLYSWHPEAFMYLKNQFFKDNSAKQLMSFVNEENALAFMDRTSYLAINQQSEQTFSETIVPVFPAHEVQEFTSLPSVSAKTVRLGWLGRLDSDKIYTIINLLDMLMLDDSIGHVDLHIVGDGSQKHRIKLGKYAPKVRFIFTSFLYGDDLDLYFRKNVDLAVVMGMSALSTAQMGIPTLIPITSSRPFQGNRFVFLFDSKGQSLSLDIKTLDEMGCQTYPIGEAIKLIYAPGAKEAIGRKCYDYVKENFSLEQSAKKMLSALENSCLTVDSCRKNPVFKQQLSHYRAYKRLRPQRDYFCFILFVQKIRRIAGMPFRRKFMAGIKLIALTVYNFVKPMLHRVINFCWAKIKGLIRKRQYFLIQDGYPGKIQYLRKYAQNNDKINVAFLVIMNSVFPSQPVFEKMLEDDVFNPYIIVVPDQQRSLRHKIITYNQSFAELQSQYPGRVLHGFNVTDNTYLELGEKYQVVFFNNPYSKMAHKYHFIRYFLDKNVLPIYVNYGFFTLKYGRRIINTDFYNLLWRVCIDSRQNYEDLCKHQVIRGKNAIVTGYIKMDRLASVHVRDRKRKLIIIAPHHTVMGWDALDISNFLSYSEMILKLPEMYPEVDFVFRPHPLLFSNLIEKKIWTQDKIDDYISQMNQHPNARYDNSGDYLSLFMNSDAMIHDCGSFIGEYLFTEKPCCYVLKSQREIDDVLLPMGKECMAHYYKAFNEADIMHFIEQVIVRGEDPMKEERIRFARQQLKFNYPHAANVIIEEIKNAIHIK